MKDWSKTALSHCIYNFLRQVTYPCANKHYYCVYIHNYVHVAEFSVIVQDIEIHSGLVEGGHCCTVVHFILGHGIG